MLKSEHNMLTGALAKCATTPPLSFLHIVHCHCVVQIVLFAILLSDFFILILTVYNHLQLISSHNSEHLSKKVGKFGNPVHD